MSLLHAMRAHVRDQRVSLAVTLSGLGDAIRATIDAVSGAV